MVGHIDGYNIKDCPKLRRVEFRGPVNTTGVRNSPQTVLNLRRFP